MYLYQPKEHAQKCGYEGRMEPAGYRSTFICPRCGQGVQFPGVGAGVLGAAPARPRGADGK